MSCLHLRLFGGIGLETTQGNSVRLPTKRVQALLAYLAVYCGRLQPRAKIAVLLWENSAAEQARESLRQTLSLLRKCVNGEGAQALIANTDGVALSPDVIFTDVAEFERLIASEQPADWGKAADLYRGPFLDSFDLRAAEFENWTLSVRQQFHEKALAVLDRLASHHLAAGAYERGIGVITRLISFDPMRESAHRTLMEFYLRQGRYAAALQQYQVCADTLSRQLGVEPEPATTQLCQQIREQRRKCSLAQTPRIPPTNSMNAILEKQVNLPQGIERRYVTVMSCELTSLAEAAEELDPEELHTMVDAFRDCCAQVLHETGGTIGTFAGTSITALFGYPEAREHGTEEAIRTALILLRKLRPFGIGAKPGRARIGVATGMVTVAKFGLNTQNRATEFVGGAPRLANILLTLAEDETVLVTAQARNLVGDRFEYIPVPSVHSEVGQVWRVLSERPQPIRFNASRRTGVNAFVGRVAELQGLHERWRQAAAGEGRVELLTGEPGIGKSRIALELSAQIGRQQRHRLLRYQCSPFHRNSALHPFIHQLEYAAGIGSSDAASLKLEKLARCLAENAITDSGGDVFPLLVALLSIPSNSPHPAPPLTPAQLRRKTLTVLLNLIERHARTEPLLMVFEDAQWADASSLELLDRLVERVPTLHLLLLVTCRPGFTPDWVCLDHVGIVTLEGLDRSAIVAMVNQIGGEKPLPAETIRAIIEKTDGVPIFVEELTEILLDTSHGASSYQERNKLIPLTLQTSLMARLDQLGETKGVAQVGAVIGRCFSLDLLQEISTIPEVDLRSALARLVASGLVHECNTSAGDYAFKHALIRDAAYQSLLKSQRQRLHAAVAQAMLDRWPALAAKEPALVAFHFSSANDAVRALPFWFKAGLAAAAQSANKEAIAIFETGLALFDRSLDMSALERNRWERHFLTAMGASVMAVHGYGSPQGQHAFERARALIDEATPPAEQLHILWGVWNIHFGRSDLVKALELAQGGVPLAQSAGLAWNLVNCMVGQTLCAMGEFERAQTYFHAVDNRAGLEPASFGVDEQVLAHTYLARIRWALGFPADALAAMEDALQRARRQGNSVTVALALVGNLFMASHGADLPDAANVADDAIAHCEEYGLALFGLWARFNKGVLLARQKQVVAGIEMMRCAIAGAEARQNRQFRPFQLGCVARSLLDIGEHEDALVTVCEGIAIAETGGEMQSAPFLYRTHADVLRARGRHEEARSTLLTARAVAVQQRANLELAHIDTALRQ